VPNDELLTGPDLLNSLVGVYGISGDIRLLLAPILSDFFTIYMWTKMMSKYFDFGGLKIQMIWKIHVNFNVGYMYLDQKALMLYPHLY
jgi:hypothetical protein